MWRYVLNPPFLINVAALPCESGNSENIILQWDITKENCVKINVLYMLHRNGPVDYKIWGVVHQRMYEIKICDICDLQKCLMQTWVECEWNIIEAAIDQWRDHLRSCERAAGGYFQHMLRNYCLFVLCGSSEHFMKLTPRAGSGAVSKWVICACDSLVDFGTVW